MKLVLNAEMKRKLLLVLCISVIKEACFWIFHDNHLLNTILKLLTGVAIFLISDLMLLVSIVFPAFSWIHIPSILLFYLSIALFLLHCAGTDQHQ